MLGLEDLNFDYAKKIKTNHTLLHFACEHMVFGVRQLQKKELDQISQEIMVHKG